MNLCDDQIKGHHMHAQTISFDQWRDINDDSTIHSIADHGDDRITWGQHPTLGLVRISQGVCGSIVELLTEH
jgi:hypothetical protein